MLSNVYRVAQALLQAGHEQKRNQRCESLFHTNVSVSNHLVNSLMMSLVVEIVMCN
jgi:hypothetical protein